LVGLSPLGAAREALGFAIATDEFGARFFSQGAMPSGVVTLDKFLTPDQRVIARDNLNQLMSGLGNAHKFALFEGGMKPEPWANMPLEDMQFVALRKFSLQEICRFYRIPPHMVADLDRATFSNIEHMSQEFVTYTMMPYFTRYEASVRRWLMSAADRERGLYLRFNFEGLLRADSTARAAFLSSMLQNGIMTRNEARAKENLNQSDEEGMDDFTIQANMMSIEKAFKEPEPVEPTEPVAPPVMPPVVDGEDKGARHITNLVLPDTMKQHITQDVRVPNMKESLIATQTLTREMVHGNKSMIEALTTTAKMMQTLVAVVAGNERKLGELKEAITADRVIITDDDGEPIGSRLATKEHA